MTLNSEFFHGSGFRPLTPAEQVATSGYYDKNPLITGVFEHYVVVPSAEANFFDFSQSREENLVVLAEGYNAIYGINYLYPVDNGGGGLDGNTETPFDDIEFFEKSGVYLSYPSNYETQTDPLALHLRVSPKVIDPAGRISDSIAGFDGLSSSFSNAPRRIPSTIIDDFTVFEGYVHYLPDKNDEPIKLNYKDLLYKINKSTYNTYVGSLDLNETLASGATGTKLGSKNKDFMVDMEGSGWFIKRQAWGPEPSGLPPVNPNDGKNPLLGVDPCPGSVKVVPTRSTRRGWPIIIDKGGGATIIIQLIDFPEGDLIGDSSDNLPIDVRSSAPKTFKVVGLTPYGENRWRIVIEGVKAGKADIKIRYASTCGKGENDIEAFYKDFPWWDETKNKFLTKTEKLSVQVIDQPGGDGGGGGGGGGGGDGVACTDYGWASYGDSLSLNAHGRIKVGESLDLHSILPFVKKVVDVTASDGLELKDWSIQENRHHYTSPQIPFFKNGKDFKDLAIAAGWQIRGVKAGMHTINFTVDAYCYDKSKIGSSKEKWVYDKTARIKNEFGHDKTVAKIYTVQIEVE
jgi:hypothetical protein